MSFPIGFAPADELNDNMAPVLSNTWAIVVVDKNGSPTDELVRLDRTGVGLCLVFPTPNTNFNATINCIHHVQTDGGTVTATLPASPMDGDIVAFADRTSSFNTNNLTLDAGANDIANQGSTYVLSNNDETVWLQFDDTPNRWNFIVNAAGGGGGLAFTLVNESASFNATAGNVYHWDSTGGAGTATMPGAPTDGDIIAFVDVNAFRTGESGFDNAALTIDFNGNNFLNGGADYILDQGSASIWFQWNQTETTWVAIQKGIVNGLESLAPTITQTGNFNPDPNTSNAVDTTGGAAFGNMPVAPDGAIIIFFDSQNNWATNNFQIVPGFPATVEFDGTYSNIVYSEDGGVAILQYDKTADNWKFLVNSNDTSGGTAFTAVKETINFAGVPGTVHHVDTTGGQITASLPAGTDGDIILFADAAGSDPNVPTGFGNNSLVINPNGAETIQGFNSITLDVENEFIGLQYLAADSRWNVAFGLTSGSVLGSGGSASDPGFITENGETLAADKVLLESDEEYQFLDPGGSNRNVDLPTTPSYARRFVIIHDGGADSLDIRISAVVQDTITTGQQSAWVYSTSLAAWRQI